MYGSKKETGQHKEQQPTEGHKFSGKLCAICSQEAKHVCPICQSNVCNTHFKVLENRCVMCSARKNREDMKNKGW